ncbi:hypothetical protein [Streptomyces sp. NPDC048252]|uniref:hypothetical protein n=1 Tax=Streptomyces sp. NPDC048252 TaxID=3154612 RepID=UPI0034317068
MTDGDSAADAERRRLAEADEGVAPRRRWGPYLSERQWGTVREDYSTDGDAWSYFTHDQARSRAYARDLSGRLASTFLRGADGHRPVHGAQPRFAKDPHRKDLILFCEYFHGDHGAGLGASHQTGWTGLVAATTTLFHTLAADEWHRGGRVSLRPKSDGDREEPLS